MRICAIGDPHGDLRKIKKTPTKNIDLILLTGDLGSANLMRKMAFKNIEREKKGLPELKYSPKLRKRAFMEAYNSSMRIINYLAIKKKIPCFVIYGNVESSNVETKKISKEIKLKLPFLTDSLNKIKNVRVINNKLIMFRNIKIGGLEYFTDISWVKEFKPRQFKKAHKKASSQTKIKNKILKKFGKIDIFLCHQPPFGFLDKVNNPAAPKHWAGKRAGSKIILDYIKNINQSMFFAGISTRDMGIKK